MAKKSTAARQTNAAHRSQSSAKTTAVRLVRQPGAEGDTSSAGTPVLTRPTQSTPARPAAPKPVAKPVAKPAQRVGAPRPVAAANPLAAAKPAAPKPAAALAAAPAAPSARTQADRAQAAKVARAREIQRARAANLITPEHYDYVIKDLRLIGVLAASMFTVIIILHFVMK